jgi:hypothetical protein
MKLAIKLMLRLRAGALVGVDDFLSPSFPSRRE